MIALQIGFKISTRQTFSTHLASRGALDSEDTACLQFHVGLGYFGTSQRFCFVDWSLYEAISEFTVQPHCPWHCLQQGHHITCSDKWFRRFFGQASTCLQRFTYQHTSLLTIHLLAEMPNPWQYRELEHQIHWPIPNLCGAASLGHRMTLKHRTCHDRIAAHR